MDREQKSDPCKLKGKTMQASVSTKNRIISILFQLSVISYYTFNLSVSYYKISKAIILVFFVIALLDSLLVQFKLSSVLLLPGMFLLLVVSSFFWAIDKDVVIGGIVTQFQYFLLLFFVFYVVRKRASLDDYYRALYISGVCLIVLTIFEYGLEGLVLQLRLGIRLGARLGNENIYGMAFAQSAIVAFYYFSYKKEKIALTFFAVFSVFALGSGSKKAFLMIPIGVFSLIILKFQFRNTLKLFVSIGIAVIVFLLVSKLPIFQMPIERLIIFVSGESSSDAFRFGLIKKGLNLLQFRPLLGYGYGSYSLISGFGTYAHNNFIELAINFGILGLLTYYSMYMYSYHMIRKKVGKKQYFEFNLLFTLLIIDVLMGVAMVQFVEKSAWISMGVYLASAENIRFSTELWSLHK